MYIFRFRVKWWPAQVIKKFRVKVWNIGSDLQIQGDLAAMSMVETVMMETAVENAVNIIIYCKSTLRRKEGYILCLNEYRGLYSGFVCRVVIMLDNARSAISEYYYEYYGIPRNTSRSAKNWQNLTSCVLIGRFRGHQNAPHNTIWSDVRT